MPAFRPMCSVADCPSPVVAKGLCNKHYQRQNIHGSTATVKSTAGPNSFPCIACGARTEVKDSRAGQGGLRRRRVCKKCHIRFTTYEVPADESDAAKQLIDGNRNGSLVRAIVGLEETLSRALDEMMVKK